MLAKRDPALAATVPTLESTKKLAALTCRAWGSATGRSSPERRPNPTATGGWGGRGESQTIFDQSRSAELESRARRGGPPRNIFWVTALWR
eukprot:CAMPEP_0176285464 /NCGR_PEP_ID=MMETSP0121_2-20121125/52384_1 /TAXON_ID=160619 /ORGANISM="Kryptoperidinium foliaceum, Strain CCMP 1326" /LENGTH=90 /DNA_ID=CAMNT_0017625951 /DNA_START=16 /DNA_END=284 /DNA_ORIENTATION=-